MSVADLLHVTVEPFEDAIVVRATGEVDMSTVHLLRRELDTARAREASALLDLSGVTFMDSTGLHLLIDASHTSATSDWGFFVVRLSGAVRRLIEVSGAGDVIMVVDPGAERVPV
jgi:anti-sigma B factor antagonist